MPSLNATLKEYGISTESGFVPSHPPQTDLSSWTLTPWLSVAHSIPSTTGGTFRSMLRSFPLLSLPPTATLEERRLSYVCLTHIAHAYIWDRGVPNGCSETERNHLPASVAVPLLATAEELDIPPCLTFASEILWNWRIIPNFKPLVSFTGLAEESVIVCTFVEVERLGGKVVAHALEASRASGPRSDLRSVENLLGNLRDDLDESTRLLMSLPTKCDPQLFIDRLRPYFSGFGSSESGLPDGVFYGTSLHDPSEGEWHKLPGTNIAQSSFIHALDTLLGIVHDPDSDAGAFLQETQNAMPGDHARFLCDIQSLPSLVAFIRDSGLPGDIPEHTNDANSQLPSNLQNHSHSHAQSHSHSHPIRRTRAVPNIDLLAAYTSALRSVLRFRHAQIEHVNVFFIPASDPESPNNSQSARLLNFLQVMKEDTQRALRVIGADVDDAVPVTVPE